jgi:hypothetical protein
MSQQPVDSSPTIETTKQSYVFQPVFAHNGIEYPFDSTDVDTMEIYEECVAHMNEDKKKIPKDGAASVRIRAYCAVYERFFDALFGEGAFLKLCGGKYSMYLADELLRAFLKCVNDQRMARESMMQGLAPQYMPNRAERRAAGKK